jgi:hypothetical protein
MVTRETYESLGTGLVANIIRPFLSAYGIMYALVDSIEGERFRRTGMLAE